MHAFVYTYKSYISVNISMRLFIVRSSIYDLYMYDLCTERSNLYVLSTN
jgi:hypothetical protein